MGTDFKKQFYLNQLRHLKPTTGRTFPQNRKRAPSSQNVTTGSQLQPDNSEARLSSSPLILGHFRASNFTTAIAADVKETETLSLFVPQA